MHCNSLHMSNKIFQGFVLLTCLYSHNRTRAFMAAKWIPIYSGTDRSLWVKHAEILRKSTNSCCFIHSPWAPIVRDGCCRQEDLNIKQISSTMASPGTRRILAFHLFRILLITNSIWLAAAPGLFSGIPGGHLYINWINGQNWGTKRIWALKSSGHMSSCDVCIFLVWLPLSSKHHQSGW